MPRRSGAGGRIQGGSPGVTRTPDQRFRKPLLYPSELRGHFDVSSLSHADLQTEVKWRGGEQLHFLAVESEASPKGSKVPIFAVPSQSVVTETVSRR